MYLLYASKVVLILRINLIKLVKLDMSKAFDTLNICVLIRRLLQINLPGADLNSSPTTSRNATPTQHTETTHSYNVNLKLAFLKVASCHPHYLIFTLQTCYKTTYIHRLRGFIRSYLANGPNSQPQ